MKKQVLFFILCTVFHFNMNAFDLCKKSSAEYLDLSKFWDEHLSNNELTKKYLNDKNTQIVYSYFVDKVKGKSDKLCLIPDTNNVFIVDTNKNLYVHINRLTGKDDLNFEELDPSDYLVQNNVIARLIQSTYKKSDSMVVLRLNRYFNYSGNYILDNFFVYYQQNGKDYFLTEGFKKENMPNSQNNKMTIDEIIDYNKRNKIEYIYQSLVALVGSVSD